MYTVGVLCAVSMSWYRYVLACDAVISAYMLSFAWSLDLDDAAAPVDPGVGLVGLPAELGGVEPVEVDPVLGRLALAVEGAADLHVAVRRVDVGEIVLVGHFGLADDVLPVVVEVAVDELLRQVGRGVGGHAVVGCEAQGSRGTGFGLLGGPGCLVGGHTAVASVVFLS